VGDVPLFLDSNMFLFERADEAIEKIKAYFELYQTEEEKIRFGFAELLKVFLHPKI
jgi:hypothetical protein